MSMKTKAITMLLIVAASASTFSNDLTTRGYRHACLTMNCGEGSFCAIQNGGPQCFPSAGATCSAASCSSNLVCRQFLRGATCMTNEKACEATECCAGSFCAVQNGKPQCFKGAGAKCANYPNFCPAKTTCVQFEGGATCMRNEKACATMTCEKGSFCSVENGKPTCLGGAGVNCTTYPDFCPVNTTCVQVKEGAKCVETKATTIPPRPL